MSKIQIEVENKESFRVFLELLAYMNKFYYLTFVICFTCSLKFRFSSIITPGSLLELEFLTEESGNEIFVVMSRLEKK